MWKKLLKNTVFTVAAIVLSAVTGACLLFAVYLIPEERIRANVDSSAPVYDSEGLTNLYIPWLMSTRMDNYTDSIMLSEAAYKGDRSAMSEALTSNYVYVTDINSYYEPGYLRKMLDPSPDNSSVTVSYARYWHGYLILLKPILLVTGIWGIRMINAVFQVVMLALVMIGLYKNKDGRKLMIPLILSVLLINPVSTVLNMQFACVYNLMLTGTFIMLKTGLYRSRHYWRFFLFMGIAVAYFDFLTYPLVSIGIPLIIMTVLGNEESVVNIRKTIFSFMSWGIGYVFMWASKWVICDIVTGSSIVKDAFGQILVRTVTNAYEETGIESGNVINVIGYNLNCLADPLSLAVIFIAIAGFVIYLLFTHRKFKADDRFVIPLLLTAIVPFVWYMVLSNHSAIHFWMTYRNLALTSMAFAAICATAAVKKKGGPVN